MRFTEHYRMKRLELDDIVNVDDIGETTEAIDEQQFRQDSRLLELENAVQSLLDVTEALKGRVTRLEDALFGKVTSNPFSVSFEVLNDVKVTGVWNRERGRIEC